MNLHVNGTLEFPTNGPKLKFPEGSIIIVNVGGLITATFGPGSGSADFISIGTSTVWKKADGDVVGYACFGCPPLPVEILSFEANKNEQEINLKWVTTSEINNDYFTIERSVDTKIWKEILITVGAGNSSQILEYFETDYHPLKGISYYRLKQTDYNGEFSYSNIVPVKYVKNNITSELNLFPNPLNAGSTLYIEFKDIFELKLLVVLRDMKGREYYSKVIINVEDGKLIGVPTVKTIPDGIYLVTASSKNQIYGQKLIIRN
jgi:hypothetical protein